MMISHASATFRLRRFFRRINVQQLTKRYLAIAEEIERNSFIRESLKEHFEIEIGLFNLLLHLNDNKDPHLDTSRESQRAFHFAVSFLLTYQRIPVSQREALLRRLDGYLKDDQGLAPLEHELATAQHLENAGFSVTPGEFSGLQCDWLARKDNVEFEIECKHVSKERGRRIPVRAFARFAGQIIQMIPAAMSDQAVLISAKFHFKDGIEHRPKFTAEIAQAWLSSHLRNEQTSHFGDVTWETSVIEFPVTETGNLETKLHWIQSIARKNQNREDPTAAIALLDKCAVIIEAISKRKDDLLLSTEKQLHDSAKRQFTKTRPAVLYVRFAGLSQSGLTEIASRDRNRPTSLAIMASRILKKRLHLHTISFPSLPEYQESITRSRNQQTTVRQSTGEAYSFKNEQCSFKEALNINFFSQRK